jgi:hypothetical protein
MQVWYSLCLKLRCGIDFFTCTMGNRFCSFGRLFAAMQRSSQRVVRWVASSKRAKSAAGFVNINC